MKALQQEASSRTSLLWPRPPPNHPLCGHGAKNIVRKWFWRGDVLFAAGWWI